MNNIALIAPTQVESRELRPGIEPLPDGDVGVISKGSLHGRPILFSHCGIGKVNAAHSVTLLLEDTKPDILILFGIGGAYAKAGVGDVVIAVSENYGEEGVMTPDGWKPMEFTGFPLLKTDMEYFNTFAMDKKLSQLAIKASKDIGLKVQSGNFITVSQCSGTRKTGEIIRERFNGICENMEGAAVAHICAKYAVPMIEIRGISNIIEDRDFKKWNIPLAVSNCSKAVNELVRRL
ncbi:MAG: futalosine hydrolase [Candidatus Methanoperedens sp.]|nr:futalosine hydrolase [Candidatus Methanoperedens sp.]